MSRQMEAFGFTGESIAAISDAKGRGQSSLNTAVESAMETRDPNSDTAKAATEEEAADAQRQADLVADMKRLGLFPTFKTGKQIDGIEVYDPATDELIGTAKNGFEATSMAFAHLEMEESAMQNQFDQVASLAEASRLEAENATDENAAFTIAPGERMTVERLRSELIQDGPDGATKKLEHIDTQLARLSALERNDGGDGAISATIFGEMETETRGKERSMIRKLYGGASILTLTHENAHANFKGLLEKGTLSLEETASFFQSIDAALAGKKDRNGEQLRFLPEGVTAPSFEQLDEAVAEFAEVMLLRTKGGQKTAMRQLLNTNLSAMAKSRIPGAAKFRAFIRSMRELFGMALSRSAAIKQAVKDGKIDDSQVEQFRALMQGTSAQEEFDADVKAEYDGTFRDESAFVPDDDNPFSIGRAASFPELSGKPKEAVARLLEERRGWVPAVWKREDIGDIALVWGDASGKKNKAYGLAKIERWHPEMLGELEDFIKNAELSKESENSAFLKDGKRFAVLRKNYEGEAVKWVLTAYEEGVFPAEDSGQETNGNQPIQLPDSKNILSPGGQDASPFSIGHSSATDTLISDATKRVKRPETRVKIMRDIARRLEAGRRDVVRMIRAFGKDVEQKAIVDPRQMKSLRKERNVREAVRRDELENEAYTKHQGILEDDTLAKLKEQPVHAYLADPESPLKGSLMSRGAAIAKGENFYNPNKQGDYDGASGVSRSVFGGTMAPDVAAQELFEAGLIKEPTPDALWNALTKEAESVSRMKEYLKAAKADMKDAKATVKREAEEWLAGAVGEQARDHSLKAKIRRALVTLDAILMALPAELRGKVGGYTALANLNSDEARLEYLLGRIEKVDQVVERWLKSEFDKSAQKLLKRAEARRRGGRDQRR